MAQALRVPLRDAARVHLQQRADAVLRQIAQTLRRAQIQAKARVQFSSSGAGRVVVYVQGFYSVEASLLLPGWLDGFTIFVV